MASNKIDNQHAPWQKHKSSYTKQKGGTVEEGVVNTHSNRVDLSTFVPQAKLS